MYKVIIVEDEILVRIGLKSSIDWESLGMEVVDEVSNGKQALESYYKNKPDLILTDVKMPVMDGLDLIRKIRERDTHTKIIILTCYEEFDLVHQALKLGVSDYVLKLKMSPKEIEEVIRRTCQDIGTGERSYAGEVSSVVDDTALRNTIIKEQLLYNTYGEARFADMAQKLDMPLASRGIRVALMSIGSTAAFEQEDRGGQLVRNVILNLVVDMLSGGHKGVAVHEAGGRYLLLLGGGEEEEEAVCAELEHINTAIKNYIDVYARFYLSRAAYDYGELSALYKQCEELVEQGYFCGGGKVIIKNSMDAGDIHVIAGEKLRAMAANVNVNVKGYGEVISSSIDMLLHVNTLERRDICRMFSYLIQWPIANSPLNYMRMRETAGDYADRMDSCTSIEENIELFNAYISALNDQEAKGKHVSREIAEVVQIIGETYSTNISLQAVAAKVGISPNYLSTLFKKELGMKFVDYINQVRIDHAKELLLTTHLKSYEVAERVGFYDESYFSRIFKNVTGMRPKEWKRQLLEYEDKGSAE